MSSDFPRILTLLRKEKGISQKNAAAELGISQALLSHYEKGIRECGLDFLIKCADFYEVSCDYLLGRSPDRQGSTLTVEDIPEGEANGKENRSIASVLPVLNKRLITNSLHVLFDLLMKAENRALTGELSAYLMLAVYRAFRVVYAANLKNQESLFGVPEQAVAPYTDAAMQISAGNAAAIASGRPLHGMETVKDTAKLSFSTDLLNQEYPQFSSSLLNLIQTAESRVCFKAKAEEKKKGKAK
jgi:transcriptional regulator with XRE-family HTH domain